jgi:glycosyltransferase involved in cell wall biosynthesis
MLPFVSIIVPVLNRREMLNDLLGSFAELQYPCDRFEVIVIDNGSIDGTWELLKRADSKLALRSYRNDNPARLPVVARDLGAARAKGEILAFTDSDCLVSPDWLDAAVACFQGNVGIVQGKTMPFPNDRRPMLHHTMRVTQKSYAETCNIFYRAEALARSGGFSRDLFMHGKRPVWGEDVDLAYRVKELGYEWVFCERAFVYHRVLSMSFWSWLYDPFRIVPFVSVVRRHPQIRSELLYQRYFFTPSTQLFDLLVIGTVLAAFFGPWWLVLAIPFLVEKVREGGTHLNLMLRAARVFGGSVRALLLFGALVYASVRFRTLVL